MLNSSLDVNKISKDISFIKNNLSSMQLFFVERIKKGNGCDYIIYNPSLSKDLNEELSDLLVEYLQKTLNGKTICEFNPIVYEDDTLEFVNASEVASFTKIRDRIETIGDIQSLNSVSDFDFGTIWFYCIKMQAENGKELILFKKYSHSRALKSGFTLFYNKGTLNKFDRSIITIDDRSDAFYLDNKLFVLNRYFFELIFNFSDTYKDVLENALEKIRKHDIIDGLNDFEEECLDSNSIAKKFTRIMREGGLETFLENKDSIPAIIQDYNLNVKFRDGKLVYEDKTNLWEIIKLLSNDFVEAALNKQKYEARYKKPI